MRLAIRTSTRGHVLPNGGVFNSEGSPISKNARTVQPYLGGEFYQNLYR